jgi:thiol-disulfide isomerase/thioredoxin
MENKPAPRNNRLWVLVGVLFFIAAGYSLFHQQLNGFIDRQALLRSPSPDADEFSASAAQLPNPAAFLKRCWATGKVPHRELVMSFLAAHCAANPAWFAQIRDLLLAGTADPDMSVREVALAILQSRDDPRLFDCTRAQLRDPDPLVRRLGLEYLRKLKPDQAIPTVMPLLDDPDLTVAASADVALMHWTGEDFGVRVRDAIPSRQADTNLDAVHVSTIRQGIARRKLWYQVHAKDYPLQRAPTSSPEPAQLTCPVEDFALPDLAGKTVRLREFRGKTVLLNFWTTWCTACQAEIPDLIALRNQLGGDVIILGISLDGAQDEHGKSTGEDSARVSPDALKAKVARTAHARGINYPVLLDPEAIVGRRFNGGELPTTVIIDRNGYLRRRFIGERTVTVFKAMLTEAQKPTS